MQLQKKFVYLKDEFVEEDKAFISIKDRSFLYGDGVFETIRTYQGKLFLLKEHLDRLEKSAAGLHINLPQAKTQLQQAATKLASLNWPSHGQDFLLRITVSRGEGEGLWPQESKSVVVMQTRNLPLNLDHKIRYGVKVIISQVRRNYKLALDPTIKSCNFLNNILAQREANLKGAAEALILNYQGNLTEGAMSNVFVIDKNGVVCTPPVKDGLLPGITRDLVLKLAKSHNIEVKEKHIQVTELYNSKEIFLTLTSAGILPVVKVNDCIIGKGVPGKATRQLLECYNLYVKEFINGLKKIRSSS